MKIEDGKGNNGDASVSSVQRLNVSAKTAPRETYAARDFGQAFSAIYTFTSAAGEHVAYLKNTSSTRNLFVGDISFGGVVTTLWKGFFCTGTAAAGEVVTATPMNKSKSIPAECSAMAGDTAITGLTADGIFTIRRTAANDTGEENFEGTLILGPGDAIVIESDTTAGGIGEVDIHFHYENLHAS